MVLSHELRYSVKTLTELDGIDNFDLVNNEDGTQTLLLESQPTQPGKPFTLAKK